MLRYRPRALRQQPGLPDRLLPALRRDPAAAGAARRRRRAAAAHRSRRAGSTAACCSACRRSSSRCSTAWCAHTPYGAALSALVLAGVLRAAGARGCGRAPAAGALPSRPASRSRTVFLTLVIPFALDAAQHRRRLGARRRRPGVARLAPVAPAAARLRLRAARCWPALRCCRPRAATARRPSCSTRYLFNGADGRRAASLFAALLRATPARGGRGASAARRIAEPLLIAWATLWLLSPRRCRSRPASRRASRWRRWIGSLSAASRCCTSLLALRCGWPTIALPALLHAPLLLACPRSARLRRPARCTTAAGGPGRWRWRCTCWCCAGPRRAGRHARRRHGACARRAGAGRARRAAVGRALDRRLGRHRQRLAWLGWLVVPAALLLVVLLQPAAARDSGRCAPSRAAYQQLAGGGAGRRPAAVDAARQHGAPTAAARRCRTCRCSIRSTSASPSRCSPRSRWALRHAPPSWLGAARAWPQVRARRRGFVWLNAMLIRAFHHYGDVPYRLDAWTAFAGGADRPHAAVERSPRWR